MEERLRSRVRREVVAAQADEIRPRDQLVPLRLAPSDDLAGHERPQHALPADGHEGGGGRDRRPLRAQLVGNRDEHPPAIAAPGGRQRRDRHRVGLGEAALGPSSHAFDVLENGPAIETCQDDIGARRAEEFELRGLRGERIHADQGPHTESEAGQGEARIRHRAAEPPATGIVGRKVAGGGPDDQRDRVVRELGCILQTPFLPFGVDLVFL